MVKSLASTLRKTGSQWTVLSRECFKGTSAAGLRIDLRKKKASRQQGDKVGSGCGVQV